MKKILGVLLAAITAIALCLGFAGCGKGNAEADKRGAGFGTEEPPKEEEPTEVGQFKNLKEAYEAGWITKEDLKSIAYYYNEFQGKVTEGEFLPVPKNPSSLDKSTVDKMKRAYREQNFKDKNQSLEVICVGMYYGTYHGSVVLDIGTGCMAYDLLIQEEYVIGEAVFYNYSIINVWREN